MDPFNMPAFGQFDAQADLSQKVAQLAPLATTWHGVEPGVAQFHAPTGAPSQGVLPAFWGKIESVGKETRNITTGAAKWLGHNIVNAAEAPYKFGESLGHGILDRMTGDDLRRQSQELSDRLDSLASDYKSGRISGKVYADAVKQYNVDSSTLMTALSAFQSKVSGDQQNSIRQAADTGATITTIITLGASAAVTETQRAAAGLLANASELTGGAEAISKLATSEEAWKAVSPLAQNALRIATQQVLEASGKQATAAQISRAVAVKLLLDYPLTYNALSSSGQQIYDELNNSKYGDAVKTIAFNAALLMSGGIIGWGIKNGSRAIKATEIAVGLRPGSILDELSSRIGNGDRSALAKIAKDLVKNGNEDDVKAMIVGLESNLKAAGGNTAKAVNLITDHLENYVGWGSMTKMEHQQAWDNIVNYWKHAEGLNSLKKAGQIVGVGADDVRTIVPGRFTVQDKNAIAAAVSQDGQAGWDAFKAANPNIAAANNPNLDRQIVHLIETESDPSALGDAIRGIPAQFGLEGIPKEYAAQMAKDGYVAIIPQSHNLPVVPFAETAGKLATRGATGDYFVSAGTSLPVLRSAGAFLTWAGLSPDVAGQRVGEIFKQKLAQGLEEMNFPLQGGAINHEASAKDLISKLSNYAKAPEGRIRLPVTDLRQLTTSDVMKALDMTRSEAKTVQSAILQAHLDVPRAIAGLGTKIMDRNFKYNPVAAPYSKVQGALRFSWNPIFEQGKLPIKAEILSQMQTGGKFPTVAGTNTFMRMFFPGKYAELDNITKLMTEGDLLPGGLGAEAADITGSTIAHAPHYPRNALLPVAGVVSDMAAKVGLDSATFIKQFPTQVQDAATAILHYDRNANFLNSPMARTLNFAFFPFRFNVKVSTFMAKAIAKQEPIIQYAVVKGMMNAGQFLKSPQGQAWYSQNSDVITLFKYFSPVETLSVISSALQLKHDSVAQYGELGGLPFGWIPQLLDSVGLTHFGQAYVNPKTGAIAKDYVPTSAYGALNTAIQDLIGSLFTYPGATVGLPSKGSVERKIVGGILPGSSTDFKAVAPANITPEDRQFSQTVQQLNGTNPPVAPSDRPAVPAVNVPLQSSPLTTPRVKKPGGATRKKKSDYRPELLPGQSVLGQL